MPDISQYTFLINYYLLDSEWSDKCIDFTAMCVLFLCPCLIIINYCQ